MAPVESSRMSEESSVGGNVSSGGTSSLVESKSADNSDSKRYTDYSGSVI